MSLRQKCPHCARFAEFVNDFCVSCWSHRTKGAVLTAEQVASSKQQYSTMLEAQRLDAAFEKLQRATLLPVAILSLWNVWWAAMSVLGLLAEAVPLHEMVLSIVSLIGLVVGGLLLGGRKSITVACALLITASVCAGFEFIVVLLDELDIPGDNSEAILWTSVRLFLAGSVVVGAIRVLRSERPATS
jgi:hypothetical protein